MLTWPRVAIVESAVVGEETLSPRAPSSNDLLAPVLNSPLTEDPSLLGSDSGEPADWEPISGVATLGDASSDAFTLAATPLSELSPLSELTPSERIARHPQHRCHHCGSYNTVPVNVSGAPGRRVCQQCGCDVQGRPSFGPRLAMRFGWWGIDTDGATVKTGEYQDLSSSPFWDLDGTWSNRQRTLDFTLSGLDNEANQARAYFYGPHLSTQFEYNRYLRRLDHIPLSGFDIDSGTPGPTDKVVSEDLNVGDDYAIRVQQLDATVKGQLTSNLKWKVNLWGMRKSGERQANAVAHCFNINTPPAGANYTCHVLSQRQQIDWTTLEITPAVEARIGEGAVEYSRTMRAFGQNDQTVDRTYTAFDFSPSFGTQGQPFVYGWVPENFTQIDRFKINQPINGDNQLYAHLYFGQTENDFRNTQRDFNGLDLRLTNRAIDDVTLVAYSKLDTQRNTIATEYLTTPPFGVNTGPAGTFEPSSLRHPIDYTGTRFGLKGNWQSPSQNWLSMVSGYEFFDLSRDFVTYETLSGTFTQEDTQTHQIHFGPYMRVSRSLDTYVRYKGGFISDPLIGVRTADGKFNTNQPEQVHRIEIGGTWHPKSNLLATFLFGIENSWHHSQYANFDEDNYPIMTTLWYAPTERLTVSLGYAFLSNWIDQDITIGFLDNPTETTQWNYDGYSNLVSCHTSYAYSPRTNLVGGVEWNRGSNVFAVPASPAGADWTALPTFSDVIVETTRVNVGVDHEFRPLMTAYFRYVLFDYDDRSVDYNSGRANMFLGGLSWLH